MINISGFKEEVRYRFLIGKLLSYKDGFEGFNISDPDFIELIESSKGQKQMGILIDYLEIFHSQKKHKFSIRIFSALRTIMLNYLDLFNDLVSNKFEINLTDFFVLIKLDSFYTIKDGVQFYLIDSIKDHELLKNKDFLIVFFFHKGKLSKVR